MSAPPAEKWLLLFNCQAQGLAHSLTLQCSELEVEFFDPTAAAVDVEGIRQRLDSFDRVLVAPGLAGMFDIDPAHRSNAWLVPALLFYGFHPDFCELLSEGRAAGPKTGGGFNSTIAYAAFSCGLDEAATHALYREDVYARLGYLDHWEHARRQCVNRYRQHDLDIERALVGWSRAAPFMHTPNHPHVGVLRDLAKVLLERAGLDIVRSQVLPHDNLGNASVLPVYPEIGLRIGVEGNYLFKRGGRYRLVDLAEFLAESFHCYRALQQITIPELHKPAVEHAMTVVRQLS